MELQAEVELLRAEVVDVGASKAELQAHVDTLSAEREALERHVQELRGQLKVQGRAHADAAAAAAQAASSASVDAAEAATAQREAQAAMATELEELRDLQRRTKEVGYGFTWSCQGHRAVAVSELTGCCTLGIVFIW